MDHHHDHDDQWWSSSNAQVTSFFVNQFWFSLHPQTPNAVSGRRDEVSAGAEKNLHLRLQVMNTWHSTLRWNTYTLQSHGSYGSNHDSRKKILVSPLKINGWTIIMEVWRWSFSFLNGWLLGSILILQGLPSLKLTVRPWKWAGPQKETILFQASIFRGENVSFRGCIQYVLCMVWKYINISLYVRIGHTCFTQKHIGKKYPSVGVC